MPGSDFAWTGGAACKWQCLEGHYRHDSVCHLCTELRRDTCRLDAGQQWQACTRLLAETCVPCPRIAKGLYSGAEQYVVGAECVTACLEGHFNHTDLDTGVHTCRPCSSTATLAQVLDAQAVGLRDWHCFESCTATRDTTATKCELAPVTFGSYTGDAASEGENCPFACDTNYHPVGVQCIPCIILAEDGSDLPPSAYTVTSTDCDFTCNADTLHVKRPPSNTCVLCDNSTCNVGHFLTGGSCSECLPCTHTKAPDWVFASEGRLDDAASCAERCPAGMFAAFETCVAHTEISCDYARQYLLAGTHAMDAMCLPCSSCRGRNLTRQCSPGADAECEDCPEATAGGLWSGTDCALSCLPGRTLTSALGCELCAAACGPGRLRPTTPDNCTHCLACPGIPAHAEFTEACAWECGPDHEGNVSGALALYQPRTVRASARPQLANLSVRCGPHQILNRDYGCVDCVSPETGVVTPDPTQEGLKWDWNVFGAACSWDCTTNHFYYERSKTAVFCYTWDEYTVRTLQLANQLPESMPTEPLTKQRVQTHAIQFHEWMLTAGAVVALSVVIMATCV